MRKHLFLGTALLILLLLALNGCADKTSQQDKLVKVAWKDLGQEHLQNDSGLQLRPYYLFGSADLFLNEQGVKALGTDTKVLIIKRGEAPSGGYGIKVTGITLNPQKQLVVQLEKIDPKPGQAVTLASTYPMVAVTFPDVGAKEIVFQPELDSLAVKPQAVKKPLPFTGSLDAFEIPAARGGFLYPLVGPNQVETLIVVREPAAKGGYRLEWIDLQADDEARALRARVRLQPPKEQVSGQISPLTLAGRVVGDYHDYRLGVEYVTDQNGVILDENQGLVAGVRPHMIVPIQPQPEPHLLAPTGELRPRDPVIILGFMDQWTQIKTQTARGWIPSWYLGLAQDSQPIQKLETPETRVLKSDSAVFLYPTGPAVSVLEAGKLLTVQYHFRGWAFVSIIVYDIPAVSFGWVKQESLVSLDQATPIEGYLKSGGRVYHDFDQKQLFELSSHRKSVLIQERRGEMAYLFAAGGWTGWTKLSDIIYERE